MQASEAKWRTAAGCCRSIILSWRPGQTKQWQGKISTRIKKACQSTGNKIYYLTKAVILISRFHHLGAQTKSRKANSHMKDGKRARACMYQAVKWKPPKVQAKPSPAWYRLRTSCMHSGCMYILLYA